MTGDYVIFWNWYLLGKRENSSYAHKAGSRYIQGFFLSTILGATPVLFILEFSECSHSRFGKFRSYRSDWSKWTTSRIFRRTRQLPRRSGRNTFGDHMHKPSISARKTFSLIGFKWNFRMFFAMIRRYFTMTAEIHARSWIHSNLDNVMTKFMINKRTDAYA